MNMRDKIALTIQKRWLEDQIVTHDEILEAADAVLDALMEPSEEMAAEGIMAAIDADLDGPDGVGTSEFLRIWKAAIRAARDG